MGELIGSVIASIVKTIYDLIDEGYSAEEAAEMAQRNIKSLRAQYLAEKAEDEAALEDKHGRS